MAKILIVDDSKSSRKILKSILEADGHEIIGEAVNGEEGVTMYQDLNPDITTMDITMPIMDGIESLTQIMAISKSAKVIMVSASAQKSKILDSLKLGAAEFLPKPFDQDQIINVINKVDQHTL